ncbi:hemolysin family protein [Paracoccus sp. DMF-8]|uniref:hemolysin family protein n=1 Tax=Paracoccus sp. DMF-8 TaxID=3019445 RepID=UPI0023E37B34|nr:hemolysin family protein [Paracoccus sp. DMF-8]MDF3607941.1 hemolysin family protein [Paracoccus sp. DMF-8]
MFIEIAIILVLTLVNGVLAMAELAMVSSRPVRLAAMAEKGSHGARLAMELREQPGEFLSAVQIGITLVGILNGAFSGATLGLRASAAFAEMGVSPAVAAPLGVGIVVAAITYLSLVAGELVPKQIALARPEAVSALLAPMLRLIAKVATPLVWLLDTSTKLVLGLLRINPSDDADITDEDVRMTIAEATRAGVILPDEHGMIAGVMRVADRSARGMMTPRRDVETVDLADPREVVLEKARRARTSRIPVSDGANDNILGVVAIRDLVGAEDTPIRDLLRDAPMVLDTAKAMSVVEVIRRTPERMVLVYDELGHFQGVINTMDILEAIAGDFDDGEDDPDFVRRADGSWLVAGAESADEFASETGFDLPEGDYETVAGLVLHILGQIPRTGDTFDYQGWAFEIADMDGMRIDRVIVAAPKKGEE